MKRIIQLLLVFLLLVPVNAQIIVNAKTLHTYKYQDVIFSYILMNGKAVITTFKSNAKQIYFPSEIKDNNGNTYPVQSINLFARIGVMGMTILPRYKKQTSVVIEPGIENIDDNCFSTFKSLSQVTIPNTIKYIGKDAFPKDKNIAYTMPSTIRESDLLAGLPVKVISEDNVAEHPDVAAQDAPAPQSSYIKDQAINQQSTASTHVTSDVDMNIPSSSLKRENTFCLVIGNEAYQQRDTPNVKYAMKDSKTFSEYCIRTLGVPDKQVRNITNATYIQFIEGLRWLKKIASVYGNEAKYIVYYAGHGIPDEKGNCCLLPTDVSINDVENGFNLSELYKSLGSLTTNNVLVFIDACFSGNDRNGEIAMNDEHRGVMIEMREENVPENVVVMTATSQKETALAYNEKGHGYFTYFLLKKLQETKGDVTYGELYDYIRREVSRTSVVNEQKIQTPTISTSSLKADLWKSSHF